MMSEGASFVECKTWPSGPERTPQSLLLQVCQLIVKIDMQVILLKQINGIGNAGDIKNLSDGYFRNFLFPRGLAQPATPENMQQAERVKEASARKAARNKEEFKKLLASVQKESFVLLKKANEEGHLFGSVTEKDIAHMLQEKKYPVSEDHIVLPHPLKVIGTYTVQLQFDHDIEGSISLAVERGE